LGLSTTPMFGGGFTGEGPSYQSAGQYTLHKGEYVVPERGALVMRGGGEDVALLRQIVSILREIANMGPGRVNATIYTDGPTVQTNDLLSSIYGVQ